MTKSAGSGSKSGSRSISQRHGSADSDPNPHQNVMDPEHCYGCSKLVFVANLLDYQICLVSTSGLSGKGKLESLSLALHVFRGQDRRCTWFYRMAGETKFTNFFMLISNSPLNIVLLYMFCWLLVVHARFGREKFGHWKKPETYWFTCHNKN